MAAQSRVLRVEEFGGPAALREVRVPVPDPGPGEVLVRVRGCGINRLDVDNVSGVSRLPLKSPHVPGREVTGLVEATGSDAPGWRHGDPVLVLPTTPCGACVRCQRWQSGCTNPYRPGIEHPGGYADHLVAPATALVRLCDDLDLLVAAAVPIAYGTAYRALSTIGGLRPGETVLVTGSSGGVGTAALDLARHVAGRTIAVTRSPAKRAFVHRAGADVVLTPEDLADPDAVAAAAPEGVDLLLDIVGGTIATALPAVAAHGGRIVVIGAHSGEQVLVDLVVHFRKELQLLGVRGQTAEEVDRCLGLVRAGRTIGPNPTVVAPAEVADTLALLQDGRGAGKYVIDMER